MTAPEPTPAVGDCPTCGQGPTSAVHIVDCRPVTAPTSGETSPVEAAAEALGEAFTRQTGAHLVSKTDRETLARASAEALLAGDWLERVLAETSPCVWSIREENHPYGRACLDEHPDRHPGVGFCWVRPKKQAAAVRATAGVGL